MSVCYECCALSGRGLCDELITRPEESYRICCVGFVWSRKSREWGGHSPRNWVAAPLPPPKKNWNLMERTGIIKPAGPLPDIQSQILPNTSHIRHTWLNFNISLYPLFCCQFSRFIEVYVILDWGLFNVPLCRITAGAHDQIYSYVRGHVVSWFSSAKPLT
jgi:hypothetical protein